MKQYAHSCSRKKTCNWSGRLEQAFHGRSFWTQPEFLDTFRGDPPVLRPLLQCLSL
jgi:hypothetical protein